MIGYVKVLSMKNPETTLSRGGAHPGISAAGGELLKCQKVRKIDFLVYIISHTGVRIRYKKSPMLLGLALY